MQVYPVVASHRIGAFLAVIKDSGDFSDYDRIILHHVVTVTALELVKKKAVAETEKRLAGDFFDELIASDLYEEEIARRLAFFGLEPQSPSTSSCWSTSTASRRPATARASSEETVVQDVKERLHWAVDEFMAQRDLLFISASHSDSVVVLVQLGKLRRPATILTLAGELQATIAGMMPEITVSVGIGRPHRQLIDLRQSYYEASYAIQIRKLKGEHERHRELRRPGLATACCSACRTRCRSRSSTTACSASCRTTTSRTRATWSRAWPASSRPTATGATPPRSCTCTATRCATA